MERAALVGGGRTIDVIHQHGIWTGISRVTDRWRARSHGPTVIAPHGSLEAWALKRSVWKKRLASAAYESSNLTNAAVLHATSHLEATGIRVSGAVNPIALVHNGISAKWLESTGDGASFCARFGIAEDRRVMLYVGRITPVKNLTMLIDAMASLRQDLRNWLLVIVGRDEFGHQRQVEAKIAQLQMEPWVRLVGSVTEAEKRDAYDAAEVVALPSLGEASPIVILEALGAAVPVLTTKGVPWEDVDTYRCGWQPDVSVEAIGQALRAAINTSPSELRAMGQRGRQLVDAQYRWSHSAHKLSRLYDWLLGRAGTPEFILDA